jgi:hypothetical protein
MATDTPVLDLLATMTADSLKVTRLDAKTLMLVRLAALVGVDAPPASYLLNLAAGHEIGLEAEDARNVLEAVAPIVGTPHVMSALTNIGKALGLAIEITELDSDEDDDS